MALLPVPVDLAEADEVELGEEIVNGNGVLDIFEWWIDAPDESPAKTACVVVDEVVYR